MNKIKYSLASPSWDNEEYSAIQRVVDSGRFTMGNEVREFEKQFAKYFSSNYSVMVNSGSSANLLMVASLFYRKDNPLVPGDEIIVPAVSWSTTYLPLQQYNLKVKFVDVDLNTLNYNLDDLREAVSEKTRAILAVNLLGNPNDFNEINDIIGKKDILLLEDNCESLGAEVYNKKAGAFGLMGSFSSFFSHHISTMEGGMIVTNDEEIYHILLTLRAHGWTRDLPDSNKVTGRKEEDSFKESYKFVLPGYNLRPLELSGAIGKEQLKKLDSFVHQRRRNARLFNDIIELFPQLIRQKEIGKSSYFGFSIILKENQEIGRERLIKHLTEVGIECRPIVAGNFTKNKVIKYFDYSIHGNLPNADYLDRNGFFIGNHHFLLDKELQLLKKALEEIF